jgi:hypothetical protein
MHKWTKYAEKMPKTARKQALEDKKYEKKRVWSKEYATARVETRIKTCGVAFRMAH